MIPNSKKVSLSKDELKDKSSFYNFISNSSFFEISNSFN